MTDITEEVRDRLEDDIDTDSEEDEPLFTVDEGEDNE